MNKRESMLVLYSLKNCPFAMRARLAICKAKQPLILRNIVLSNKPKEMLIASPKGTVPILVISPMLVLDQSLEIMLWILGKNDPDDLLYSQHHNGDDLSAMINIIYIFDNEFKRCLEKYHCAKRYHDNNIVACRQACEIYLQTLEQRLTHHKYIMSEQESLVDIALLPFIRQFARIEHQWYLQSPYPKLRQWLNNYLQSQLFSKVMTQYPLWLASQDVVIIGSN